MKFAEIVPKVIDLAKKANEARTHRGSANVPIVSSGPSGFRASTNTGIDFASTSGPGPWAPPVEILPLQEETDLLAFLEARSPESLYMLAALMYLGRGDFNVGKLLDYYEITLKSFGHGEYRWAARQLADKYLLPQYLEGGWMKARAGNINFDAIVPAESTLP